MMVPGVGIVDHRYRYRFRSPPGVAGNDFPERFPFVYSPFPLV